MPGEAAITREQMADLMARVYALVRACPPGRVTTFGWIGKALGYPRGARMIGWIMNEANVQEVPAQRVVNSKGELSGSWAFGQKGKMRQLLESNCRGGGRSLSLPRGVPLSIHASRVTRSSFDKLRSLANLPCLGSACQGGMRLS